MVIGKRAKNVPRERALEYVFGYTCANDVSARDWQKEGGGTQWCRGKVVRKPSASAFVAGPNEQLVDVELWIENQIGEITTKGSAVVALPIE